MGFSCVVGCFVVVGVWGCFGHTFCPITPYSHPSPQKRYLTLQEAVNEGYGAYSSLRKYISEGKLPAVRQGRRIRIRQSDLESLLNQNSRAIDQHIAEVVDAAPHLSDDQIARLRLALGGGQR